MRVPFEWLTQYVEAQEKPEQIAWSLTMGGLEVEAVESEGEMSIFDIGVTPNRSDCLSVIGVAREVAAVTDAPFSARPATPPKGEGRIRSRVTVSIKQRNRCFRYAARVIEDVKIGPSPQWMVERLAACGLRSINNVVDATNYVMLETGQPLHAFDLDEIRGSKIIVKLAAESERFTTLDGVERTLSGEDLLICDAEGPVALAGVMGGQHSEVKEHTTRLLLESASFEASGIRKTSKRSGLASESSRRFERGVDPNGVVAALHRLTELILETSGGTATADWVDLYPKKILPRRLSLGAAETNRLLGTRFGIARIGKLLSRAGLSVGKPQGNRIRVSVPSFRPDITRPVDLIEEVARLHGYGEISESMPSVQMKPLSRPQYFDQEVVVRQALIGSGFSEAVLMGFVDERRLAPFGELGPQPVRISNPLSQEQGVMTTTLLPGLLDALKINVNRQRTDVRLFALQKVFYRPSGVGPADEPRALAGVMSGKRFPTSWERSGEMVDFYDAKGAVGSILEALDLSAEVVSQRGPSPSFLHPGRFAYVLYEGMRIGFVGQLHPDIAALWDLKQEVLIFELHFELLAEYAQEALPRFQELSKFPSVMRDISIVVDERTPLVEIEKAIADADVAMLDHVKVFDVYQGKGIPQGKKSLAISLIFSRDDRTLTEEEVTEAWKTILGQLATQVQAELRDDMHSTALKTGSHGGH